MKPKKETYQRKTLHPLMRVVIGITIASVVIFVVGLLLPPPGDVSANLLKGIGLLTGQQALVVFAYAVYSGKRATFTHGNTTASVGEDDATADITAEETKETNE